MSSQNYWADNLRILQWMISDVNEEKTVLHDIKSSFCYHVLEQKYIPSSKSQTAEIISAILACDSDHEIWSKTTFDEKEQDCYIRDFSERFGIATLREMLLASDLDLVFYVFLKKCCLIRFNTVPLYSSEHRQTKLDSKNCRTLKTACLPNTIRLNPI